MKVGVTAWKFGTGGLAAELAEQGEIAERIGFDSFWLPESHFAGDTSSPQPLMLLAAIAARTSTIGLGTTSYLLPVRHPVQAAEEVAVLDRMSGGRVILGVGRGFADSLFSVFDVPVKDKRKRFKANLDVMKAAWAGEPLPGSPDDAPITLSPRPVQEPHPRIWVAAFGPLAIKQAGSLGLPYISSPMETIDDLEAKYNAHQEHARDAGYDDIETVPVMRTLYISDKRTEVSEIRARLEAEGRGRMRADEAGAEEWSIVGDASYVKDRVDEYRERLGLNYLIARGRIPGVSHEDQVASHERLATLLH